MTNSQICIKPLYSWLLNHPDDEGDEIDDESVGCWYQRHFQATADDGRANISDHFENAQHL